MADIFIDNEKFTVSDGQNLLNAVLSLGFDLPYFCWHPSLGSVGACRQCAVVQFKDENDTKGRIVMACMTPAANGTRISINNIEARTFRAKVIEWLMTNHPHDCPVCDEGGECHLQDMTVMTGHNYRRFRFQKRTHRNQDLGPFVYHEMNRCIACYRCVRFYRDWASSPDLDVFGAHNFVYFGRHKDGVLQSEFAGNLVEVCPTGVFTDKTFRRHYTRKWDLQNAPSICNHCGVGCNTIAGERYGRLRRIRNRYNYEVNGYFLCDRGRYGYEFVECDIRTHHPLSRPNRGEPFRETTRENILEEVTEILSKSNKVIGIGSPRATLESNFALQTLVGKDNFFTGLTSKENALRAQVLDILSRGPARAASLLDINNSDAVLIMGEDLINTAPMSALAVMQAVRNQPMEKAFKLKIPKWDDGSVRNLIQNEKGPLYIASPAVTKLDSHSKDVYRAAPDDIARLGFAVAHAIDNRCQGVSDLPEEVLQLVNAIAVDLKNAKNPIIISGVHHFNEAVVQSAANIAWALCKTGKAAQIYYAFPECNSVGTNFTGGGDLEKAFEMAKSGEVDTAIIMENDLYRRADKGQVDEFLEKCKSVIVLDYLHNPTSEKADIVLSSATFAEGDGTLINNEGRIQRYFQALDPVPDLTESWRWIAEIMRSMNRPDAANWNDLDDIAGAMFDALPAFGGRIQVAPDSSYRIADLKIARKPHRYSGRTAETADISVHEPMPPPDPDSALKFSMEGYHGVPAEALNPNYWAPGWNSAQAVNKYQQEVGGPLIGGDPGVRLIEPATNAEIKYFDNIPPRFKIRSGEYLIVALYHIYGSEELSSLAEGVAELIPKPYLAINSSEAAKIGVESGSIINLSITGHEYQLPLAVIEGIPDGIAGLPMGLDGLHGISFPIWGTLGK